jgi:hypothetical protein
MEVRVSVERHGATSVDDQERLRKGLSNDLAASDGQRVRPIARRRGSTGGNRGRQPNRERLISLVDQPRDGMAEIDGTRYIFFGSAK